MKTCRAFLCSIAAALFLAVFLLPPPARAADDDKPLPSFPLKWEYKVKRGMPLSLVKDTQGRPYLYIADKDGGLVVLNVSTDSPETDAVIGKDKLDGMDAMYVAQQGDYLYVALGDFFDIKGAKAGLAVIDVSEPEKPAVASVWASSQTLRGASAVLVDGDTAYVSVMQLGVLVFDVSDKKNPKLLSSFKPYVDFPHKNPGVLSTPKARGMALHDHMLLLADDSGGLRLIDVSDPLHLKEKAAYINADLMRKQQAYNAVALDWPLAYVTTDYCGLEVVDLSDLRDIRQKGTWNPWHCDSLLNYWFNSPGHTNQIALDAAHHRLYMSAGDSELRVLSIANPAAPELVAGYGKPKNGLGTWGMTLTDDAIYLGYIKAKAPFGGTWSGVKALKR
ncbi:MAG: hypothetical protein GC185_12960 [Alphaproteobacteria bacterium]|nr:hypothetical protein [Alphaproteobacteria bacterium]